MAAMIQIRYFCPRHRTHYMKPEEDRGQPVEGGHKICSACMKKLRERELPNSLARVYR